MSNYSFFVGSDVSKAFFDVSFHQNNEPVYLGQYPNSNEGFTKMFKDLKNKTNIPVSQWFICFENTGNYSKLFLSWLVHKGIACIEENPLRISNSLGMRRGKSDKTDSLDICQYVFEKRDSIKPTVISDKVIVWLKKLLSRRDFLVRHRQALRTSVKEQKGFIDNDLYEELKKGNELLLNTYTEQIKVIEQRIQDLIQSDEEIKKSDTLIKSIIGIGNVTSAYLIATTNNFQAFTDSRKYASYSGIAPFPKQSGIRKAKKRVSHMANKKIKSILSNCALSAIRHDPQLALYYNRKINENKETGIVLNAVKNKLVQRIFAVIKRQSPYVKFMTYA